MMNSPALKPSGQKKRLEILAVATVLVLCLFFGFTGVVASKGITVLVILAGFAGLAAWISTSRPRFQLPRLPFLALMTLLVWAGVSSVWASQTYDAFILALRLMALCLAGTSLLHLCHGFSAEVRDRLNNILLAGYALGLVSLIFVFFYIRLYGDSPWGSYFDDPLTTLNNGAVIMALLLWPVAAILWKRIHPAAAFLLVGAVTCGLLFLTSGASLLSIGAGLVAFIVVFILGRPAGLAIGIIIAGFFIIAPPLTNGLTQSDTFVELVDKAPSSAKHRLLMWNFVGTKIDQKPVLGWGMDSSRHLPQDAFRLNSNTEIMPLHPHNAALQIRLELGWPGIIITAALIVVVFLSILPANLTRFDMAIRTAIPCAYLSVGCVSYGVWQNWWIATAWALVAILSMVTPPRTQ